MCELKNTSFFQGSFRLSCTKRGRRFNSDKTKAEKFCKVKSLSKLTTINSNVDRPGFFNPFLILKATLFGLQFNKTVK